MAKHKILLYGATGFMGRMIAELAVALEVPIVLAGRNPDKLDELNAYLEKKAADLDVRYASGGRRAFPLEAPDERAERLKRESQEPPRKPSGKGAGAPRALQPEVNRIVDAALYDVRVVLNAAGPFGATAESLARACMRTDTQYVDICGEYDVINRLRDLGDLAEGSLLMPGVGLTVLCSDLLVPLALEAGQRAGMSQPRFVRMALSRVPFVSRGSAKTMLQSVRNGVLVNRFGKLERVPIGQLTRSFAFDARATRARDEVQICTALTLADLRTAGRTASRVWEELTKEAGVTPSVETYVEASSLERFTYQAAGEFAFAFRSWPIRPAVDRMLSFWPEGPPPDERDSARQQVVVEVEDRYRRAVHVCLDIPNSYDFTARVALRVARLLLNKTELKNFVTPGELVKDMRTFFSPDSADARSPAVSYKVSYHGFPRVADALYAGRA